MGLISADTVIKRGYELLLASPRNDRWSGTGAGQLIYNVPEEGQEVVLDVDGEICCAIVETEGNEFRPAFFVTSSALTPVSGTTQDFRLPATVGAFGYVEVKQTAETNWTKAERAHSTRRASCTG